MHPDCKKCFLEQAEKLLAKQRVSDDIAEDIISRLQLFIDRHVDNNLLAPEVSCLAHRLIRKAINVDDLYEKEKHYYNSLLLNQEEEIRSKIRKSDDPFRTALLYALAGNIIDLGPRRSFDVKNALSAAISEKPVIDHSLLLKDKLENASTVLYLGDNAGEIVLDKLFIETINHPDLYFATRGGNVINDITYKDALNVGITKIAKVVPNGYDAPSTLLNRCSPEFREIFDKADIIISKGQGNLEGLISNLNKKIFFLFMVKCKVIAEMIGVEEKSIVVFYNQRFKPQDNI
ncbi:MAG: ARMT1-like domain-containing protein [Bacteroidales bacterium]